MNSPNYLYAPTMKGVANDCLEMTMVYWGSQSFLGVWDFCKADQHGFAYEKQMNGSFWSNYARNLGDGLPEVTVETAYLGDGQWHAFLYNFSSGRWEDLYDSRNTGAVNSNGSPANGNVTGGIGWTMFETHYFQVGFNCPVVPTMSATGIRRTDGVNWQLMTSSYSLTHSFGDCFNLNSQGTGTNNTGPSPYTLNWLDFYDQCQVIGGYV